MIETLPRLLVLQAWDQRIQQAIHTLDTHQRALAAVREEEQDKRQAVCAWQEKVTDSEKAHDSLTLQIEQVKGQLRGKRGALHRRRAGQQEEAVQGEIALLEASKAALEEELSVVTAKIAQDLDALHQAEELASAHHAQALAMTSAVGDQCMAVEEKLRAARDERPALTSGINTFLLQEYERIFSRRGGVAVVALANEACQGCHMHLPPQMCLELQRRPKLTFCPHCHRILFVPVETHPHVVEPYSATKGADGHPPRQPRQHAKSKARAAKEPEGAVLPPANPAQM
jgi:hypothetical protein